MTRAIIRTWTEEDGPCRAYAKLVDTFTVYVDQPDTVELVRTITAWGYVRNTGIPCAFIVRVDL